MGTTSTLTPLLPAPRFKAGGLNTLATSLDFGPWLSAAMRSTDADLIKKLADIIILSAAARLGATTAAAPAATQAMPAPNKKAPPAAAQASPAPAARQTASSQAYATMSRQDFDGLIVRAARRHGLDPSLVRAVVKAESDFDPTTISRAGAMGLMQLMPETARDLGVADPFDPAQNIEGGSRYLAAMLRRFGGQLDKALAAYNWGPSNVERGGRYPAETRRYLAKVMRLRDLYEGGFRRQA